MDDYGYIDADSQTAASTAADYEQDPDDIKDYGFDWSGKLDGDEIASSTFLLPDGMTAVSNTFDDTKTVVFVSGGTASVSYRVTNRIVTDAGRQYDKTIRILVRDQ